MHITTERERELIDKLMRLVARRAKDEVEIRERYGERNAAARSRHEEQLRQLTGDFQREHAALIREYQESREAIFRRYEKDGCALAHDEEGVSEQAAEKHAEFLEVARNAWQHQCQQIEETLRKKETALTSDSVRFQQKCEQVQGEIQAVVQQAQDVLRRRRCALPAEPAPAPVLAQAPAGEPAHQQLLDRSVAALNQARQRRQALEHQPADKFLRDGWPILIFIFTLLATGGLLGGLVLGSVITLGWVWVAAISVIAALAAALGVWLGVRPVARRQVLRIVPEFQQAIAQAKGELNAALQSAATYAKHRREKRARRRERSLDEANTELEKTCADATARHQSHLQKIAAEYQVRRTAIEEVNERQLDEVEAKCPPAIERLEGDFQRRIMELSESHRAQRAASRQQFENEWTDLVTSWTAGLAEFHEVVGAMNQFCNRHFPPWEATDWQSWQPQGNGEAVAGGGSALKFGRFDLDLESLAGGVPKHDELAMPRAAFELPAVLSYPECPSLLAEAEGEGREAATRLIQNVMLRLLTTFPAGKVRFTIIDPVGLGQNFSAFMHLADYDQRLVTSRIWTESNHINQRLADLTEHMENVIQKYLRNEFESIQDYNAQAGEVAEPYQILVVANFPANFSEEATRRLVSIAASGARCGVYTLISTDTWLNLPRNFDIGDLESPAATLVWDNDQKRFRWKHADLERLPLSVESPPGDEQFTEIVRAVGRQAKDTSRVEVPFETVTLPADKWWTADSRSEIEAPLGRAGAMKLQYLRLGKGTSQHLLIAGKTGSGKSTLLNAMITNLAIHYSPDELQFYLVDFKKGVEFKAYAACRLPHARVIAIESEREFGLSVLERLDLELKRRGDLFRQHGVQDVKGYRNANPQASMPRILLVVDEFQEFFTSDDKISHDASLLLDRLVRQGRAFGIHVLLGSQTLAGAYSLARSTIGQMAVRIALQCSESDAHLILSEDNTAARLLSRPGEAIYNDANGLLEGNHPFQVVWLSDHQREGYLRRLAAMADERGVKISTPTVFEGNVAANPADNDLLRAAIQSPAPSAMPLAPRAWLGSAVAIKDPTDVVFRRQGGSNLLVVGQREELAIGLLANCLISLAAQLKLMSGYGGNSAAAITDPDKQLHSFYVLDGTRPESPEAGFWRRLIEQAPLGAEIVQPREAAAVVRRIAEEVERRMAAGEHGAEPIFLAICNLARFRDLKKSDDFGLSSMDDDAAPSAEKQLTAILREGPSVGVHAIVWCDSYNNLNRWIDRQTLRDLELRVLLQMSATDSSNLMDSPAASRLGVHLAIYYSEEQGQAEKFRPYGLPSPEWLAWVGENLEARCSPSEAGARETLPD